TARGDDPDRRAPYRRHRPRFAGADSRLKQVGGRGPTTPDGGSKAGRQAVPQGHVVVVGRAYALPRSSPIAGCSVRLDPSPTPSPPSSPLPVLKPRAWRWLTCLWLACACGFATAAAAAPPAAESARPQVLVLLSYHPGFSWEERILDGLREWGGAGERPVFHVEWMDAKRHPDAAQRQRLTDYLGGKYAGQRF